MGGESAFCTLFLFELAIRIFAYRRKEDFFTDPDMRKWNLFDLTLVFFMVLDTWVLPYVVNVEASQLKVLSSVRLLRLLRISRIFRMVPELGMMVKSMLAAVRSVFSTCVLGMGVMYIFAIMLTQWVKTYPGGNKCIGYEQQVCLRDYFGSMSASFLTLMQILVFDDTFGLIRPIFKERFSMGCTLILYILLVSFTVLNMLIGIICDIVAETTASERAKALKFRVEEIFNDMDTDESGTVTRQEFHSSSIITELEAIGIEPQVAKNAFDILDVDRDGALKCTAFVRMIFKCLHPPKAEDIMEIEAKVDRLADVVGLGRKAIAVLDKDMGEKTAQGHFTFKVEESKSPFMDAVAAAAKNSSSEVITALRD